MSIILLFDIRLAGQAFIEYHVDAVYQMITCYALTGTPESFPSFIFQYTSLIMQENILTRLFSQTNGKENPDTKVSSESFESMFPAGMYERMFSVLSDINMKALQDAAGTAEIGDLSHLIDLYVRIEASDTRLKGMLSSRRNAVSRSDAVVSANKNIPLAMEAKKHVEENIKRLRWSTIQRDLMDGRLHGVAIFEKIWKLKDGKIWLDKTVHIDHSSYRQDNEIRSINSDRMFGELYLQDHSLTSVNKFYLSDIMQESPRKIIPAVNTTRNGYYDLAGVMRPVARWYILKTFGAQAWAQFAETYGFPTPTITVPEDYFKKNKSLIKKLLQSVGINRFGIFFPDMKYDIHEANKVSSIEVFERLIRLANVETAIGILGQNLSSEVDGGSFAATQAHMNVLADLVSDDMQWQDELINQYIIHDMVAMNFPTLPEEEYPVYSSEIKGDIDLSRLGSGLKSMSNLVEIPKGWIYQISQIPQPNEEEDTVGGFRDSSRFLDAIDNDLN